MSGSATNVGILVMPTSRPEILDTSKHTNHRLSEDLSLSVNPSVVLILTHIAKVLGRMREAKNHKSDRLRPCQGQRKVTDRLSLSFPPGLFFLNSIAGWFLFVFFDIVSKNMFQDQEVSTAHV